MSIVSLEDTAEDLRQAIATVIRLKQSLTDAGCTVKYASRTVSAKNTQYGFDRTSIYYQVVMPDDITVSVTRTVTL